MTRIVGEKRQTLSPWVTLVERTVEDAAGTAQIFHSLSQADYVTVLALTPEGRIPLVRQFRPAVQRVTLELPGGLIDSTESAEAVAARELQEEVGFAISGKPILLGRLVPDTGRLENAFWCYFAKAAEQPGWHPERGVERVLFTAGELRNAILKGEFDHALHIALVSLAVMRGCLDWKT